MNRLTEIEISGAKYPLNFSVSAASQIYEKFGDVSGMQEAVMDGFSEKSITDTLWVLELLVEQGAAYRKMKDGEDTPYLDVDELPVLLGVKEFNEVRGKIFEAVANSIVSTVEVKPSKNAKATQGKSALRGFGFMDVFFPFRKKS